MRNLPIDSNKISLLASGKIMPRAEYGELSDGSKRRIPGSQAKDLATGLPLWIVDCFVDSDEDEDGRAEVVGVLVSSYERPSVQKFRPIEFVDLTANPYVREGRVQFSWRASGIATAQIKAA